MTKVSFLLLTFSIALNLTACSSEPGAKELLGKGEKELSAFKFQEAADTFLAALKITKKSAKVEDELGVYDKLVPALHKAGRYEQARDYSQYALELAERTYGPESPQVVPRLALLRQSYMLLGDRPKIQELCHRSMEIQEKIFGKDSPAVMETLGTLINFTCITNVSDDDVADVERLLALEKKFLGSSDGRTVLTMLRLGKTYAAHKEPAKAAAVYREALVACQTQARDKETAIMAHLGGLLINSSASEKEGQKLLEKALSEEARLSHSSMSFHDSVLALTQFYEGKKDFKKACSVYKVALDQARELKMLNNDRSNTYLAKYVDCLKASGQGSQIPKVMALYKSASRTATAS